MRAGPLVWIKLLHTAAWAVFAGSIVALPVATAAGWFGWALGLSALVWGECLVLALNRMACPLTGWAARYTEDRAPNFDIYLPRWLAEHNKLVFGVLFAVGKVYLVARWPW